MPGGATPTEELLLGELRAQGKLDRLQAARVGEAVAALQRRGVYAPRGSNPRAAD